MCNLVRISKNIWLQGGTHIPGSRVIGILGDDKKNMIYKSYLKSYITDSNFFQKSAFNKVTATKV